MTRVVSVPSHAFQALCAVDERKSNTEVLPLSYDSKGLGFTFTLSFDLTLFSSMSRDSSLTIFAVLTRTLLCTLQVCTKAFAVLPDALVVLTCTASSKYFCFTFFLESIGTLF